MSGIEDSLRDTVSYINEQISDSARSTKTAMGGSVGGTPIATFSLVGFTVILISVMLFRNGSKESEEGGVELPDEEQMIGEETSPSNPLDMEPIQADNDELIDENEMGQEVPPAFDNTESPYDSTVENGDSVNDQVEQQSSFDMNTPEAPADAVQPEAPNEAPNEAPAEAPQPEAAEGQAPTEAPQPPPVNEPSQTGGKKRKTNKKKKKAKRKQTNKKKR